MPKITRLTALDVKKLLEEKVPPQNSTDPLTVTNSILIHAFERIVYLERIVARQHEALVALTAAEPASEDTGEESGQNIPVGVQTGPMGGGGGAGAQQGNGRAPDSTPFPAGVAAQAPPGAGVRTTVISQNANPTGPAPDDAP